MPPLILRCYPHQVWTVSPSPEPFWETLVMRRESHPRAKKLLILPTRKSSLNKFTSSPIKMSVIPLSYSNFHVIILYKLHLQLQSFPVISCFIFSLYVHRCHLQHDRRIEWLKYPKTKFAFLPPFNAIWKTLLLIMLVLIFFPFPFLFQDL